MRSTYTLYMFKQFLREDKLWMTDLLKVENDKIVRSSNRNYAQSAKENIFVFFLKIDKR